MHLTKLQISLVKRTAADPLVTGTPKAKLPKAFLAAAFAAEAIIGSMLSITLLPGDLTVSTNNTGSQN